METWKEIATYLKRGVRTVRRWEREEGLPVHRHLHKKLGTVYAYKAEVDAWWASRGAKLGTQPEEPEGASPRRLWLSVGATGLAVLLAAGYLLWRQLAPSPPEGVERIMLVVLPFENLSGDPAQDYLSDGFTEEVITELGSVDAERLGVIARTSAMQYKQTTKTVEVIGKELGVDYLLEGSLRAEGDRLRVNAQLIRVGDQTHVWAERYDRPMQDVLELQQDVARNIATAIHLQLSPGPAAAAAGAGSVKPEAYEAYLRGRSLWHTRTVAGFEQAIPEFERAIELEPDFARAYAGMADCYALLGSYNALPMREAQAQAKAWAHRALTLNPQAGEVYASLGQLYDYEWNWEQAERHFQRAVELGPNYATGHQWYAEHLALMGRTEEALREARLARELDPLSPATHWVVGAVLYYGRRQEEALRELESTAMLFPDAPLSYLHLGLAYVQAQQYDRAISTLGKGRELVSDDPELAALQAYAYGKAGRRKQARGILRELKLKAERRSVPPFFIAVAHLGLGESETALQWLERAYLAGDWQLAVLQVEPMFDPLRERADFQALLRRMNFPGQ
ncbi:MAG: tetratricopeptide repeat protein [Candidatus Acidiferrales bacterium]